MKKIIFLVLSLLFCVVQAQPKYSEISSMPGSFSRMGFGARGIGMGNALSSVTRGNLVSYYNPAVSPFQENNSFQTSYSFLSLDRSLNYLNFTRRFDFYSSKDTNLAERKPRSSAGLSIGIINSGVSNIDERDNQGIKTGDLSTSENQFFLGLSNRFSERFAMGIGIKFFYYKLYEDISSTGLGFDIGALFKVNEQFNIAAVIADLNSKYKWDTSPIYEQEGTISEDKFPLLKKIALSYFKEDIGLLAAIEFQNGGGVSILRAGAEFNIFERLFLRAGLDQYNLTNSDIPAKPSAGFSYSRQFDNITVGIDYAFMMEQYSPSDRHIVGLNITF